MKRKICVVLTDRANYGRMWPVMMAIKEHPELELQTICTGTMLLERFGQPEHIVESDGFEIEGRIYIELEGSVPSTMTKSLGFGIVEFASEFPRLGPDVLLIIGDRFEALAAVVAAAYQNITIAHIQGGEVSGSIDESARHAITKFAHYHFPATERAKNYIERMGENPDNVFNFGCPTGDYILSMNGKLSDNCFDAGIGARINPQEPYLLVLYHPVTTAFGEEGVQVKELLKALDSLEHPTIWLWPNIDAGADHISMELRRYREKNTDRWLRMVKNYDPKTYQKVLKKAACAIGNSSSFVRDSTFSGTPVVLVGDRQYGRETGGNLTHASSRQEEILKAIKHQLKNGRYSPSSLYGTGDTSINIANKLAEVKLYTQKHLFYINHDESGDSK